MSPLKLTSSTTNLLLGSLVGRRFKQVLTLTLDKKKTPCDVRLFASSTTVAFPRGTKRYLRTKRGQETESSPISASADHCVNPKIMLIRGGVIYRRQTFRHAPSACGKFYQYQPSKRTVCLYKKKKRQEKWNSQSRIVQSTPKGVKKSRNNVLRIGTKIAF